MKPDAWVVLAVLVAVALLVLAACTPEQDAAMAGQIAAQDWDATGRTLARWCCGGGVLLIFLALGALVWGIGWLVGRCQRQIK